MRKIVDEFSNLTSKQAHYRRHKKRGIHLFYAAKARAKKFNIPFNLNHSDIQIPEYCPILNIPIILDIERNNSGRGPTMNSPSLDKIIPELGYVKGNVRVISFKANKYKNDMDRETVQKILDYMDGKL